MTPEILVVGSFDTKSEPLTRLVGAIESLGARVTEIDTSVFPNNATVAHDAAEVADAGGTAHADLPALGRAIAVHVMAEGAARITSRMLEQGRVDALICMGGSNAATVFARLAQCIPTGIPKFLMSTVVAGDTRPMIEASDAVMLYPIVDIEGSNSVLDAMIDRLAALAVSAGSLVRPTFSNGAKSVCVSMFGVTTKAVSTARADLEDAGYEVLAFHANGTGGKSLERFVEEGLSSLVLDLTTTELADELFGGMFSAGPRRLTSAARRGIPQVLSTGAIDMINFGPLHTVPEKFRHRKLLPHNDIVTLVRTTPAENQLIGRTMAERLGHCTAPTKILVPLKGVSELDIPGGAFFDPDATRAFIKGLRTSLDPSVDVEEVDLHINDPEFAHYAVKTLLSMRSPLVTDATSYAE